MNAFDERRSLEDTPEASEAIDPPVRRAVLIPAAPVGR
jgi:hypothetical protein